ncbi:MAG: RNA polymerase sigma factor [Planctomycetota bacterium]
MDGQTVSTDWSRRSDEELAARTADGVDEAERELLRRHMQAIYWLPRRQFGADEEDLSDFLIYAVERIRERNTLARFDPDAGARFTTWFGVVIRNLYLDYLRRHKHDPELTELDAEGLADEPPPDRDTEQAERLLGRLSIKCRTLFKLLFANSTFLSPEELRWIAEAADRPLVEVARALGELEEELRELEAGIEERRRRLDAVCWWKRVYERQLHQLEREMTRPPEERGALLDETHRKLIKRREQYERLVEELSGPAGTATTPYRRLAALLNMKEGTLGSHLTRCRQATARILGDTPGAEPA